MTLEEFANKYADYRLALIHDALRYLAVDKTIHAIKLVRQETGCGLKDAKDLVDDLKTVPNHVAEVEEVSKRPRRCRVHDGRNSDPADFIGMALTPNGETRAVVRFDKLTLLTVISDCVVVVE